MPCGSRNCNCLFRNCKCAFVKKSSGIGDEALLSSEEEPDAYPDSLSRGTTASEAKMEGVVDGIVLCVVM